MQMNWRTLKKEIIQCVITFFITIIFFSTILKNGVVPSKSMEPTLAVGDIVIVNGLSYMNKKPQRGDIIIFKHDELGKEILIKRIIGIPGDSLMFIDGAVYLNGELLEEKYLAEGTQTDSFKDFENIPKDCYFVMGDNRKNSWDSREWQNPYVYKKDIEGKALIVIPIEQMRKILKNSRFAK